MSSGSRSEGLAAECALFRFGSMAFFRQAIDKDPNFAAAYAGLANCYAHMELYPQAVTTARKALALDSSSALAHAVQGWVAAHYDRNWANAEREVRQAININPMETEAHHTYSHFLVEMGRFDESLNESLRAIDIDPLDGSKREHLAWHYLMKRDPKNAIVACERAPEIDPGTTGSLVYLQWAYEALGSMRKHRGNRADGRACEVSRSAFLRQDARLDD